MPSLKQKKMSHIKKRVKENLLKIKMLHGKDLAITDDWSIYTDSVKNVIAQKEIEFR